MDDAQFSTFNELGIAWALNARSLRVGFREGSIAKSDVGLPDSDTGPEIEPDTSKGQKPRLTIQGSAGILEAEPDRVRFFSTDATPVLERVTYFLVTESLDAYVQLLRDAVQD